MGEASRTDGERKVSHGVSVGKTEGKKPLGKTSVDGRII